MGNFPIRWLIECPPFRPPERGKKKGGRGGGGGRTFKERGKKGQGKQNSIFRLHDPWSAEKKRREKACRKEGGVKKGSNILLI